MAEALRRRSCGHSKRCNLPRNASTQEKERPWWCETRGRVTSREIKVMVVSPLDNQFRTAIFGRRSRVGYG